jgi:plastocyanin
VTWTFTEPGTYRYFCDYHPGGMTAIITVIERK